MPLKRCTPGVDDRKARTESLIRGSILELVPDLFDKTIDLFIHLETLFIPYAALVLYVLYRSVRNDGYVPETTSNALVQY